MRIIFYAFYFVLLLNTQLFSDQSDLVRDIAKAQKTLEEYHAEYHVVDELKQTTYVAGNKLMIRSKKVRVLKSDLIAVLQDSVSLQTFVAKIKITGGYDQGVILVPENQNGMNTRYSVNPSGYRILAIRRALMPKGKSPYQAIYTPFNEGINTWDVRKEGVNYLLDILESAELELKNKQIYSRAFPGSLVSDMIPLPVAYSLALIEHIDPDRFMSDGIKESHDEALVILGANKENAYKFSVSPAGARGLFQFMPGTYKMILENYPKAKLIRNFVDGMNDHLNAAKATILLFDYQLTALHEEEKLLALRDDEFMGKYLAAAYNCGQNCAHRAVDQAGEDWVANLSYRETSIYVQKYVAVQELYR